MSSTGYFWGLGRKWPEEEEAPSPLLRQVTDTPPVPATLPQVSQGDVQGPPSSLAPSPSSGGGGSFWHSLLDLARNVPITFGDARRGGQIQLPSVNELTM